MACIEHHMIDVGTTSHGKAEPGDILLCVRVDDDSAFVRGVVLSRDMRDYVCGTLLGVDGAAEDHVPCSAWITVCRLVSI